MRACHKHTLTKALFEELSSELNDDYQHLFTFTHASTSPSHNDISAKWILYQKS